MEIIRLDHQGRGIGYIDSKIVFVPNALIGEEVEVKIINNKKKYSEAIVTKYLKKSDGRVEPRCPYFGICGGCDLLHMTYQDQLKFKQDKVENILKRKVNKIIPSEQFNYRNKASLKAATNLGYYSERTHDIVPIKECLLVDNKINDIINFLNTTNLENNKNILIRSNNNQTMIVLENEIKNIKVDSLYINSNLEKGIPHLKEKLGEYEFLISPKSFFQVNTAQALNLYNKVLEYGEFTNNDKVLDLYCGTGTIGIFISKHVKHVTGVEINASAIMDADLNKDLNHISNCEFILADTSKINVKGYNTIIVDPPRSGLDRFITNKLNYSNANKIIYVSCDPITLKRDIDLLTNYEFQKATPFDMFPNTSHVETVIALNRKEVL